MAGLQLCASSQSSRRLAIIRAQAFGPEPEFERLKCSGGPDTVGGSICNPEGDYRICHKYGHCV